MQFHDHNKPHPHLEITSDEQNQFDRVLTLEVHPPVIGSFPLVRKLPAASLHLTEWWTREAKDVMGEFSGEVTNMKVPILKSATHREVAPSEFSLSDGCFHTWNVPPSGFGKVRHTPGYWERVEDVLPRHKFFITTTCFRPFVSFGVLPPTHLLPSLENYLYLYGTWNHWRPSRAWVLL